MRPSLSLLALLPLAFASPALQGTEGIEIAAMQSAPVITVAQANKVIEAAVKKATEIKVPQNVAITDPAGHLVAFHRMDGAMLVSIDVAMKKAKTVSLFGGTFRTGDLAGSKYITW
jgi:uncharacterized protein GlcG (DUF336 family)